MKSAPEIKPGWPVPGSEHAQAWSKIWNAAGVGGVTVAGAAKALGVSSQITKPLIQRAVRAGLLRMVKKYESHRNPAIYSRRTTVGQVR